MVLNARTSVQLFCFLHLTHGYSEGLLSIDADGNTTSSIYDNNMLVEQKVYQYGDGTPVSDESFAYDPAGRQTSLIDADGNTTDSGYDGMGNMHAL